MKPVARPFHRAALDAFAHARQHAVVKSSTDAMQVLLSLDYGLEMLLKASLLERGESIMMPNNPKQSIGLPECLRRTGPFVHGSTAEVLRVHRDSLQHFAQYADPLTAADLYEGARSLIQEVLERDFSTALPADLMLTRPAPPSQPSTATEPGALLVWESDQHQRDVDAFGDTVVWAQSVEGSNALAVFAKQGGGEPVQLTPNGEFEYMPKVWASSVVAYRQSGGIVVYDLSTAQREVLTETGAPTDVNDSWIVAQGLSVNGGLGGGISLFDRRAKTWSVVSEAGDSGRLTPTHLVWQELDEDRNRMEIKALDLETQDITVIVNDGAHPSPSGDRVAWSDWGGSAPALHVTSFAGAEQARHQPGILPSFWDDRVAFLEPRDDGYQLVLARVPSDSAGELEILKQFPWAGFPTGGGPVLTDDALYFESAFGRIASAVWKFQV